MHTGADSHGSGSKSPGSDPSSLEADTAANSKNTPSFIVETGPSIIDLRNDIGTYHKSLVFPPCTGADHNMTLKKKEKNSPPHAGSCHGPSYTKHDTNSTLTKDLVPGGEHENLSSGDTTRGGSAFHDYFG